MKSTGLRNLCKWGGIFLGVLLLSVVFPVFDDVPIKLATHLLTGGFTHAFASLPHLMPSGTTLAGFAVLMILSLGALQILLAKFARSKEGAGFPWRLKWTLSLVVLAFAAVGTACATVGLAHHATWLMKDGAVYVDGGRGTIYRSISNCRQLITSLRVYSSDHGGEYPKHLQELVAEDYLGREFFVKINRMIGRDGLPAPWIFLPGLTDAAPGNLPLIIGSCPAGKNTYILGMNDSSVSAVRKQEFEEAMTRYREFMGMEELGKTDPAARAAEP